MREDEIQSVSWLPSAQLARNGDSAHLLEHVHDFLAHGAANAASCVSLRIRYGRIFGTMYPAIAEYYLNHSTRIIHQKSDARRAGSFLPKVVSALILRS